MKILPKLNISSKSETSPISKKISIFENQKEDFSPKIDLKEKKNFIDLFPKEEKKYIKKNSNVLDSEFPITLKESRKFNYHNNLKSPKNSVLKKNGYFKNNPKSTKSRSPKNSFNEKKNSLKKNSVSKNSDLNEKFFFGKNSNLFSNKNSGKEKNSVSRNNSILNKKFNLEKKFDKDFLSPEEFGKNKNFSEISNSKNSKRSRSKSVYKNRHKILRPVSINNFEHFCNLNNKEKKLKKINFDIIENFFTNLENFKKNGKKNILKNFEINIDKIWNSYLNDQKKNNLFKIENNKTLETGVLNIKMVFSKLLEKKIDLFNFDLTEKTISKIFSNLEKNKNEIFYLDPDIDYLMKNKFKIQNQKNLELKKKISEKTKNYFSEIQKKDNELNSITNSHVKTYLKELKYSMNNNKEINLKIFEDGFSNLIKKEKEINKNIIFLQNKKQREIEELEGKIKKLEMKIKKKKKNNF